MTRRPPPAAPSLLDIHGSGLRHGTRCSLCPRSRKGMIYPHAPLTPRFMGSVHGTAAWAPVVSGGIACCVALLAWDVAAMEIHTGCGITRAVEIGGPRIDRS